jgi:Flp pilus assembly protein TadG
MMRRLLRDRTGGSMVEFALLLPTFLMFIFLLLDGGRMMFAKQSLNELANATARCTAIQAPDCSTVSKAQTWAVNRGLARSNLQLTTSNVAITTPASCNSVANMTQVTVSMTWKKGAMNLLPQSVAPSTLSATSCFPIMATS